MATRMNFDEFENYILKLKKIRRESQEPCTDPDFVRFLMNTLDELEAENAKLKKLGLGGCR